MAYVIIGSAAAKRWWRDFPREPKDLDVFTDATELARPGDLVKYSRVEPFWHPSLAEWFTDETRYITPAELYTLKVSHSYWELKNGSWNKHIFDILWMQRNAKKECRLIQQLHDLFYGVWEEKYGKKRVDLNYNKREFFDDAVRRFYDHDSVHYSVAYGGIPMYELILKEGEEVAVSMKAIKALPFGDQIKLYREEIAATALERIIIPSNYTSSPGAAWKWALRRTITSLTKGWSAQFIVENLTEFVTPDDYVQRHLEKKHKLVKLEK